MSRRISGGLRESDTAARLGEDGFVVVCEELGGPAEATWWPGGSARRCRQPDLRTPERCPGDPGGTPEAPRRHPGSTPEQLLRAAGTVVEGEATLRWEHPDRGLLLPRR